MEAEQQPVSDEQLVAQVQTGNLTALEVLVGRHEARIYRFVANSLRDEAEAQDVTQETFVTAYRKISQFKRGCPFAAWLFTIARRKCIDWHRSRKLLLQETMPELPDKNDPSVLLAEREDGENLWAFARRVVPELQFQALWLRYAEDLSVADIARALGRTRIHVKVLLFRGRTRLATELESQSAAGTSKGTFDVRADSLPTVIEQISNPTAPART